MNDDATQWAALTSGDDARIAATAETLSPAARAQAARQLAAILEGAEPLAARLAAGRALALLDDPRDLDASVVVPAGAFAAGESAEPRVVTQPYRIGRYPITNAQYLRFVAATGHALPVHWDAGTRRFPPGLANHPVVFVSWHDAQAYCAWLSTRDGRAWQLPSEDEWERAARGVDGRTYPWGDVFDAERANVQETALRATSPVGAFPDGVSPCGALDMAGNVWEWTAGAEGQAKAALCGGSWMQYGLFARCAFRHREPRHAVLNDAGFRVVTA